MIVAEILRQKSLRLPASIAPFCYSIPIVFEYASWWTGAFGAPDDSEDLRLNIRQVTRDSLNGYAEVDSYEDMLAQPASFYFDDDVQRLYLHVEQNYSNIVSGFEYGFSFGVSKEDVVIIDGYEYLPLIESVPNIRQEADVVGASKPKGMAGAITLKNQAHINPATNVREGMLDFLLTEKVHGNDVIISDYSDGVKTELVSAYIENYSISQQQVVLDLQDKRKRLEFKVPTAKFTTAAYPKIKDGLVGKPIGFLYGTVAALELQCVNENDSASAVYRLPDGLDDVGSVQVEYDDVWRASTDYVISQDKTLITIPGGRASAGSVRKVRLLGPRGYNSAGSCTPSLTIEHLLERFLGLAYTSSNYNIAQWEAEAGSAAASAEIGIYVEKEIDLDKLIFNIAFGGGVPLRVWFGGDGRLTAKVKDYSRAASRVIPSAIIRNADAIKIETVEKPYSAVALKFAHDYSQDADVLCTDNSYEHEVRTEYRQLEVLELETVLVDPADARARAAEEARVVSNVPMVAEGVELADNLDIEIYDVITIALMQDNLDASSREFAGNRDALVIAVNPDPPSRINKVSLQLIPERVPKEQQAALSTSGYAHIERPTSTVELIEQRILANAASIKNTDESISNILSDGYVTGDEKKALRRELSEIEWDSATVKADAVEARVPTDDADYVAFDAAATAVIALYEGILGIEGTVPVDRLAMLDAYDDYVATKNVLAKKTSTFYASNDDLYDTPDAVTSVTAVASRDGIRVLPVIPASSTPAKGVVALILQRSRDGGSNWYDTAGVLNGSAKVSPGVYDWAFSRSSDGYPEASGSAQPWIALSNYRFRAKAVNAAGVVSATWATSGAPDTSAYGTWLPSQPSGGAGSSAQRTVTARVAAPAATVYSPARWEVQISKDAGANGYEPYEGTDVIVDETRWRASATAGLFKQVSVPQWTGTMPLDGQTIGNPINTAYYFRFRLVTDRAWASGSPAGYVDSGGKTAGAWSSWVPVIATATSAYDILQGSVTTNALADLAVTLGKIADGAITNAKVSDATLQMTKFAAGIRPTRTVSSLPSNPYTGFALGDTVTLTTDGKLYRLKNTAAAGTAGWTTEVTTVDINDAAITMAKFASGIRPPRVVASLPANPYSGYALGDTVVLTTDGKLYRMKNMAGAGITGWTTEVTTVDINDSAITMAKFASGIRPSRVVTSLPSNPYAGYALGDTVVLTTDGKLYRMKNMSGTGTTGWTTEVTTVDINDASLTMTKFAAGIRPPRVVASLPANPYTGYAVGDLVFYTSDFKVYRLVNASASGTNGWSRSVDAADITVNQLTAGQIAAGAIGTDQLAANAVIAAKIASGAVETAKLAANAVTADKIAANTITAGQIATGAITSDEIAANAVIAAKIAAGAVETDKLAANAVTAAKIAAGTITATEIAANTITAGQIATGAITADELAANSITAVKIVAGAVETDKLALNAVTADRIAANTITAGQIASGAVTADELAANAVRVKHLLIGDFTNLCLNPSGADGGADQWSVGITAQSDDGFYLYRPAGFRDGAYATYIPVNPGEKYYVSFEAQAVEPLGTSNALRFMVVAYDKNKANPSYSVPSGASIDGVAGSWALASGVFTVGAGKYFVRIDTNVDGTNGNTTEIGAWKFRNVTLRRQMGSTLIEEGGIITANLGAASVIAEKIAAQAVLAEKLSVLSRNYVNNPTATGNLRGWGAWAEDGSGTSTAVTYDATEKAMRLRTSGNLAVRSKTFQVDHNKIYKVQLRIKKSAAHGYIYIGLSGFTADTVGAEGSSSVQGTELFQGIVKDTRANDGAATANLYSYDAVTNPTPPTAWTTVSFYIVGAYRNVTEFTGNSTHRAAKLSESTTHLALRFLNWSNTVQTDLFIRDVSIVDDAAGVVVAKNIYTDSLTSIHGNLCVVQGGIEDPNNFWALSDWPGRPVGKPVGTLRAGTSLVYLRVKPDAAGNSADPYIWLEANGDYIKLMSTGMALKASVIELDTLSTKLYSALEIHNSKAIPGRALTLSTNGSGVGLIGIDGDADLLDLRSGVAKVNGNLALAAASTETRSIEIGAGRTGNGYSILDFVGDATYTDFGLRIIRDFTGANAPSSIIHRGTGSLRLYTQDAAPITLSTASLERLRIAADGKISIGTTDPAGETLRVAGTARVDRLGVGGASPTDSFIMGVEGNAYINGTLHTSDIDTANAGIGGAPTSPYVLKAYGNAKVTGYAEIDGALTAASLSTPGNASISGYITLGLGTKGRNYSPFRSASIDGDDLYAAISYFFTGISNSDSLNATGSLYWNDGTYIWFMAISQIVKVSSTSIAFVGIAIRQGSSGGSAQIFGRTIQTMSASNSHAYVTEFSII